MLEKYMDKYLQTSQSVFKAMFNAQDSLISCVPEICLTESYTPTKQLTAHIPFFGNIAGDFFFSVDETEWTALIKSQLDVADEEIIISSLKEFLNIVVGETMLDLNKDFPNLTYLSPRVVIGRMDCPAVKTIHAKTVFPPHIPIEAGISIDLMKIDINEELKNSQEELESKKKLLHKSQKMNTLGPLVEQVLLDLKSPVELLDKGLAVLQTYPEKDEISQQELKELIGNMNGSLTRIKNIAGSLVNFTKATSTEISDFNLRDCIHQAVKLSKFTYPNTIKIEINASATPIAHNNPAQIEQVIFNLLINAYDALEKADNPFIKIETFNEEVYCGLNISYNSPLFPVKNQEELWQPLFSRNKSGNITCLGLAVCREILQVFGGDLFNNVDDDGNSFFTLILAQKSEAASS